MSLIAVALAALSASQVGPKSALEKLGVALNITKRPPHPRPTGTSVAVTLVPQAGDTGGHFRQRPLLPPGGPPGKRRDG